MKIKLGISSVVAAALCGAVPTFAQTNNVPEHSSDQNAVQNCRCRLGKMEKASKVIGMSIKDDQGHVVGKVHDLAVDLRNGRIAEVLVATGSTFGDNERIVAVPPEEFSCDNQMKAVMLKAGADQLNGEPVLNMANWQQDAKRANVSGVYHYYHAQPYFTDAERPTPDTASPQHAAETQAAVKTMAPCYMGPLHRASKLMGTTVRNMNDEKVGTVDNMIVDLPAGRVVEVVIGSGGFLGLDQEMSAVPPQALHTGAAPESLSLDTTKEALANAPHYKYGQWSDNPQNVAAVYRSYNVEPYFSTEADNTARNVVDRNGNTLTPLQQGTSQADIEMTREIRKEITAADGLSVNARNVKIITVDGRVTLRGVVNSQNEKQRVEDIAAKVATADKVDDQLQVTETTTSASNQ